VTTRSFTGADVRPGAEILTADGERIGTVKEAFGDRFKVDAPLKPDFWLSCSIIESATPTSVMTTFPKDRLGDYKLENV
jgi:hypothetical protein